MLGYFNPDRSSPAAIGRVKAKPEMALGEGAFISAPFNRSVPAIQPVSDRGVGKPGDHSRKSQNPKSKLQISTQRRRGRGEARGTNPKHKPQTLTLNPNGIPPSQGEALGWRRARQPAKYKKPAGRAMPHGLQRSGPLLLPYSGRKVQHSMREIMQTHACSVM